MGTIEQRTSGRGRVYIYTDDDGNETKVPSVTTILGALPKGGLDWWGFKLGCAAVLDLVFREDQNLTNDTEAVYAMAKQTQYAPHKALSAAGNRGTDVHGVAEELLKTGKLPDLPPGTKAGEGYIDALVSWYSEHEVAKWKIVAVEARLFSTRHLYAGTVDFIAVKPGGTYVVGDLKTSKGIYSSHHLQTTAYMEAAREMGLIPADAVAEGQVIRVGIDGDYEVERSTYQIEDFLAVLAVHHVLKDKTRKPVKVNA